MSRLAILSLTALLSVAPCFAVSEAGLKDLLFRIDQQDAQARSAFEALDKAGVFALEAAPAGAPGRFSEEDLKSVLFNLHKLNRKELSEAYQTLRSRGVFDLKPVAAPSPAPSTPTPGVSPIPAPTASPACPMLTPDQDKELQKALAYIEDARRIRDQIKQAAHDNRWTSWLDMSPNRWVIAKRNEMSQSLSVAYTCLSKLPASHPAVVQAWQSYQQAQ